MYNKKMCLAKKANLFKEEFKISNTIGQVYSKRKQN